MPNFDFTPSLMEVSFYRGQTGLKEDEYISEIKLKDGKENDVFELGMRVKLGGLDYLRHPLTEEDPEDNYVPFYLNIATSTQRGQKDVVINGVVTEYFDKKRMKKGSESLQLTLTKFRNDSPTVFEDEAEIQDNYVFKYDFISNIYFVTVFVTDYEILTEDELRSEFFSPYINVLYNSKIPYIDEEAWKWREV